eukprot:16443783-Heterocapsa_arctica.AAC.1
MPAVAAVRPRPGVRLGGPAQLASKNQITKEHKEEREDDGRHPEGWMTAGRLRCRRHGAVARLPEEGEGTVSYTHLRAHETRSNL